LLRVFVGLEVLGSSSPLDHSHTACCTSHLHCALALRIRVLHLRLAFARRSCIAFCRSCLFSRFACHACIAHFHAALALRIRAPRLRFAFARHTSASSRLRFVTLAFCRAHALSRSCVRVALTLSIVCRTCIAHSHVMFVVCTRMLHLHIAR
jgi:hypothetical protein